MGPDGISPRLLKECRSELAPVFQHLFNESLEKVPTLWKSATIIPVPNIPKPKIKNDYRPIALTCVPIKCPEKDV